jgi:hypothetical protein
VSFCAGVDSNGNGAVYRGDQAVSFTSVPPSPAEYGGDYTPSATGGPSGNPVVFSIDAFSAAGECSISSGSVSFTGVGTCVIDANQAGDGDYDAAPQVQQSFTIGPAPQAITFTTTPPASAAVGGIYKPAASGGASGNPVLFSIDASSGAGVCSISSGTVSLTGVGKCVVNANQAADSDYSAAPQVQESFEVAPRMYTLTVARSGSGEVSSSPGGISCGSACSHAYPAGTTVRLTARPASGWRFVAWSGACAGAHTCTVSMNAAERTTATFVAIPPPNTTITGASISTTRRSATFDFKGSGGVAALHFECKLDSGRWESCSSPHAYTGLARGGHTFEVRAIDRREKADPTPAKRTFTI